MPRPKKARRVEPLGGLGAAVLDALPLALYVVDRERRVVAWNTAREKGPIGKPRRRALGSHLRTLLTPRGYAATEPVLRRVFETGKPHLETSETRVGSRLYRMGRFPIEQAGRVTHVLTQAEDVTEERAKEMRGIAADRFAFLGQLATGVAHEIANPLASIAGCAEALYSMADKGARGREARRFRDMVRHEVARCEELVRALLKAARPGDSDSADVADVFRTTTRLLRRHPVFARVEVAARIPKGLVAAIASDRLKQVVLALLLNAGRAMRGRGQLGVTARAQRRRISIEVSDTGASVPRSARRHLFEPFFTTDPESGTGLGLAIARSLARAHDGDVTLLRSNAKGTIFRVTLAESRLAR